MSIFEPIQVALTDGCWRVKVTTGPAAISAAGGLVSRAPARTCPEILNKTMYGCPRSRK